jgi:predicted phage-related endonuclease
MATRQTVITYDGEVELSERGKRALDDWRAARAEIAKMEEVRDHARTIVEDELGEAEAGLVDGEVAITWVHGERRDVDVKRLRSELGDEALAAYIVPKPTRTFKEPS